MAPSFTYHLLDVDCPSCAQSLERAVRTVDGVSDARVVYATQTLEVVTAVGTGERELKRAILACVRSTGADLELTDREKAELEAERSWFDENRERLLMSISGFALAAGLATEHLMGSEDRAIPFYVVAAIAGLVFVAPMALAALRRRHADMNVLMSIAVIGALIMGFTGDRSVFSDAAIVIFLDQVGEWLEGWSMRKTSGSIASLMELAPRVAHVVSPEGTCVDVQTTGVGVGYTVRVLPGERVPLDGVIVNGQSAFNEAPVTGESLPRDKGVGKEVFAGTLNTSAVVDVRVTADEDDSTLARIVSQVKGAQAAKAPYESFVTRFAERYTPIVVAGAFVLGVVVPLVGSIASGSFSMDVWHDWIYRACSLLVVACPCALVISTPVTFVSALSRAAHIGVLVKGGAYFDIACKVDTVTFDKTGTLTTGRASVTEVWASPGASEDEVLALAASLEAGSRHPLARAICACADERDLAIPHAERIEEISAAGMRAQVEGVACSVGKPSLGVSEVPKDVSSVIARMGGSGASAVAVTRAGQVVGVIAVADTLRESTAGSVSALSAERDVHMLTGDNAQAARAIADSAGITSVAAELLPQDKLEHIRALQAESHVVAMVGDGINDAPALATADLGVTMGAAASDTALEVADVALLSDSLEQLPAFFTLSKKTMRVVRENIVFAIGVKLIVFALVVAGIAGMGAAVFADTGVALIVVLNGMRLMQASRTTW